MCMNHEVRWLLIDAALPCCWFLTPVFMKHIRDGNQPLTGRKSGAFVMLLLRLGVKAFCTSMAKAWLGLKNNLKDHGLGNGKQTAVSYVNVWHFVDPSNLNVGCNCSINKQNTLFLQNKKKRSSTGKMLFCRSYNLGLSQLPVLAIRSQQLLLLQHLR